MLESMGGRDFFVTYDCLTVVRAINGEGPGSLICGWTPLYTSTQEHPPVFDPTVRARLINCLIEVA